MLPNELLERIATAYEGKANSEEQKALEQELNTLPDGQAEADIYRRLWDGFAARRTQLFQEKMTQWESAAVAEDEEEMADWYINNALHPDQQQRLAQRLKTDADFAKIVEQQQQLQAGFSALRTENFREQVQQWETVQEKTQVKVRQLRPRWFRPLVVAAGFLLLLAIGGNWYSQNNYSNSVLAGKYYKVVPTGNTMGAANEREDFLTKFDQAHQVLKAQDYATAVRVFGQLAMEPPPASFSTEDLEYYQDNIDWNLLLARLGAGSTTGDFDLRLNRITKDSSHTYHKQAIALQRDLNSFWHW